MRKAVIFLAHLNPLTTSHVTIISNLLKKYRVYVFPVVFFKDNLEVNTRSFPFSYPERKRMVESIFSNENVKILPNYCFSSPYIKYLPPLISPLSWKVRKQ